MAALLSASAFSSVTASRPGPRSGSASPVLAAQACRFRAARGVSLSGKGSAALLAAPHRAGVCAGRSLKQLCRAAGGPPSAAAPPEDTGVDIVKVKAFLDDLKPLGDIRLIVNTGVSVLESVTTFDGLFYSPVPGKGEYGNLIKPKENIDFHLLITKVASVKFENTQGRGGNYMSHVLRLTDIKGDVCVSLFLMWPEGAERGKYAPGQVEAFQALEAKWSPNGEILKFKE